MLLAETGSRLEEEPAAVILLFEVCFKELCERKLGKFFVGLALEFDIPND